MWSETQTAEDLEAVLVSDLGGDIRERAGPGHLGVLDVFLGFGEQGDAVDPKRPKTSTKAPF
jgi:hypothetical protein